MNLPGITQSPWWSLMKDGSVILAALIGSRAFSRFVGERTLQAALNITINNLTAPEAGTHIVLFEVTLTNLGKTPLRAKVPRKAAVVRRRA